MSFYAFSNNHSTLLLRHFVQYFSARTPSLGDTNELRRNEPPQCSMRWLAVMHANSYDPINSLAPKQDVKKF